MSLEPIMKQYYQLRYNNMIDSLKAYLCLCCCCCNKESSQVDETFYYSDHNETIGEDNEDKNKRRRKRDDSDHTSSNDECKNIDDNDEFFDNIEQDWYGVYIDDTEDMMNKKKANIQLHEMAISFFQIALSIEHTLRDEENNNDHGGGGGDDDEDGKDGNGNDSNFHNTLTQEELDYESYSEDVSIDRDDNINAMISNLEKAIKYCHDDDRNAIITKYENFKNTYLAYMDDACKDEREKSIQRARSLTNEKDKKKSYIEALKMSYTLETMHQLKREWLLVFKFNNVTESNDSHI
jgi:hypothetical protein